MKARVEAMDLVKSYEEIAKFYVRNGRLKSVPDYSNLVVLVTWKKLSFSDKMRLNIYLVSFFFNQLSLKLKTKQYFAIIMVVNDLSIL